MPRSEVELETLSRDSLTVKRFCATVAACSKVVEEVTGRFAIDGSAEAIWVSGAAAVPDGVESCDLACALGCAPPLVLFRLCRSSVLRIFAGVEGMFVIAEGSAVGSAAALGS